MTSLTDDAYVGTLHYKILDPPVSVGVNHLQDTCDVGNDTDTSILMSGESASLTLSGSTAPSINFSNQDLKITKSTEVKNISIGYDVGTALDNKVVEIGNNIKNAGGECVNIGNDIATAGTQGKFSVAIGKGSAGDTQGTTCVAIGNNAGAANQGSGIIPAGSSVAVGETAGENYQGGHSVAIGSSSGKIKQGIGCVAIGFNAGRARQQQASVAIGGGAGQSRQGVNAIAIGYDTCPDLQGNDSIAFGSVGSNMPSGSIAISAGGIVLTPTISGGLFAKPIRGVNNPAGGVSNSLWWNGTTSEVCFHIP